MSASALGKGPEFDRIRAIIGALGVRAARLGGDAGVIEVGAERLALSTDVSVEGVHFRREWLSPEEIGWRASAAALSDLAAVAAEPLGILVALTVAPGEPSEVLTAVMTGADAAAAAVGGILLGGDLSRGDAMSLAVSVLGRVGHAVTRAGARPGDRLWVTGQLGGARAALTAWQSRRSPDPGARERFARPVPRIREGQRLVRHGATAMLDLSDGLGGDVFHLAAASDVGVRIELDRLPVHASVAGQAKAMRQHPALFAAQGGEDYELLVAMPASFEGSTEFPLSRIGEIVEGSGVSFTLEGRSVTPAGYDHFV